MDRKDRHTPSVCPACGSRNTVPVCRAGRKWRYRCVACAATWVGKRKEKTSASR